jgi:pimeloyl-ACP methyl ester carboxylesterase
VPTLVVGGDRDVFVPVDHAVALYRQLPDARLFIAPDCDHPVMVTRPGLFNEAAGTFYRTTEAEARARAEDRR